MESRRRNGEEKMKRKITRMGEGEEREGGGGREEKQEK
jgi:hypothetical protein